MKLRYAYVRKTTLNVAFALPDVSKLIEMSDSVAQVVGCDPVSAGASLLEEPPVRDMQFEFDTTQQAEDARRRLVGTQSGADG
jgi:hypothetical protein